MRWALKRFPAPIVLFGLLAAVAVPSSALAAKPAPVVVIVMENHSYGATDPGVKGSTTKYIVGNPDAPYINGSLIPQGTLFTNYLAGAASSLPNYMLMTAGTDGGCTPIECLTDSVPLDNMFHQLGASGISFGSFAQSMRDPCRLAGIGDYEKSHNPEIYFTDIDAASGLPYACPSTDLPAPSTWPDELPAFSLVIPDKCHDMHGGKNCQAGTDLLVTAGDTWLAENVPAFLSRGAIVIVTFDEGAPSDLTGGGGHVLTTMLGPNVGAGVIDASLYTHPSLLAGLEDYYSVSRLGQAANATPLAIPTGPPPPAPTLGGFVPDSGGTSDQVTISGTNLTSARAVLFNGTPASFAVIDDSTIATTVPAGATTGPLTVWNPGGVGSSGAAFTVTTPPPSLIQHVVSKGSGVSASGSWSQPTRAGDLLVAAVGWSGSGTAYPPPGWSQAVQGQGVAIFYQPAAPATTGSVQIGLSTSSAWSVDVQEWSGIAAAGTLDVSASYTSKTVIGTTASSGTTATTARSNEIAVSVLTALAAVVQTNPTNGFTQRDVAIQARSLTAGFYDVTLQARGPQTVAVALSPAAKRRGAIATFEGL